MIFEVPSPDLLFLETSHLILEPITLAHEHELYELLSDPDLHRFIPSDPPNLEKAKERCARWSRRMSPDGIEIWLNWVAREKKSETVIAHFQVGVKKDGIATVGYLVSRAEHGKGFATEGLKVIFNFLQNTMHVNEIKAFTDSRNTASHRLALKLGMKESQTIKGADVFKGSTSDEIVFSIMFN